MEIEHVTINIVKNNQGKYLITRSPKWKHWVFPGGHVENGETYKKAAIRELEEEVKIVCKSPIYLMSGEIVNSPDFHRPAHFKYQVFLFEVSNPVITNDLREVENYKWCSLLELRKLDVIAPSHYKLIFDRLEKEELSKDD